MLRQPLEDGQVCISRAAQSLTYPASFMLVAAMNPCPCGFLGDSQHSCTCTPAMMQRYRTKLSGPLLDRIDLQVEVPRLPHKELADSRPILPRRSSIVRRSLKRPGQASPPGRQPAYHTRQTGNAKGIMERHHRTPGLPAS